MRDAQLRLAAAEADRKRNKFIAARIAVERQRLALQTFLYAAINGLERSQNVSTNLDPRKGKISSNVARRNRTSRSYSKIQLSSMGRGDAAREIIVESLIQFCTYISDAYEIDWHSKRKYHYTALNNISISLVKSQSTILLDLTNEVASNWDINKAHEIIKTASNILASLGVRMIDVLNKDHYSPKSKVSSNSRRRVRDVFIRSNPQYGALTDAVRELWREFYLDQKPSIKAYRAPAPMRDTPTIPTDRSPSKK
jgi:hypothetical protein